MSSKPKMQINKEPAATSTHTEIGEAQVVSLDREEKIRRRAYEIYLERGEQPGRELDDWLQAETELGRGVLWLAETS